MHLLCVEHLLRAIVTLFSNRITYFVILRGIYRMTAKLLTNNINLCHRNRQQGKQQQFRLPRAAASYDIRLEHMG